MFYFNCAVFELLTLCYSKCVGRINRKIIFNYKIVLLLALFFCCPKLIAKTIATNIDIFSGEVMVLGTFELERVAIGNGATIRVEVKDEGEIIVIGQEAGSSSLRFWHKDGKQTAYNVRVSQDDPETRIRLESMVRMSVKMVEIRKSAIKDIGINWAKEANGPAYGVAGDFISDGLVRVEGASGLGLLPQRVKPFSSYMGLSSSITSRLNFLASSGDAIFLAEPTLSCVNGGTAKFLAGGELPYPVTGSNGQITVAFKDYGIKLDVSPRVDSNGNIFTSILTEISQIDPAVTILDAPGLLTRRSETQVNIIAGETIVISGLLNAEQSKDASGIAGLADIPILGELFKSNNFRNNITELVIFLTPEVIEPESNQLSKRERDLFNHSVDKMDELKHKFDLDMLD